MDLGVWNVGEDDVVVTFVIFYGAVIPGQIRLDIVGLKNDSLKVIKDGFEKNRFG